MTRPKQDPETKFNSIWPAATTVAAFLFALAFTLAVSQSAPAQQFQVLYSFTGGSDGLHPSSGVIVGPDNALYGSTGGGNCYENSGVSCGTIFRLDNTGSGWALTTLYSFRGGTDGSAPGALKFGPDGKLYGTTFSGGKFQYQCFYLGCGTVFSLTRDSDGTWSKTALYAFNGPPDAQTPVAPVAFDAAGNLYGAASGGSYTCGEGYQCGAAYELVRSGGGWSENVIWNFDGTSWPPSNLVVGPEGDLYGTAFNGNMEDGPMGDPGVGVAFELANTSAGWTQVFLHDFNLFAELGGGADPSGGLTLDSSGNLYGVTLYGGFNHTGSAFKLTPDGGGWNFQTLYSFQGTLNSGPYGTLVVDQLGTLYGERYPDGTHSPSYGVVFKLTHSDAGWTYSVIHDFTGGADGKYLSGFLTLDAQGNLLGTTTEGGAYGNGVVFEITP